MTSLVSSRLLPAYVCCTAWALLAPAAGAGTLTIVRGTLFDQHQPGVDDVSQLDVGSCDSCALLESGLDVAASEYLATYNYDPSPFYPPYSTYSAFTALSGGRVGFGFIQGVVTGSLRTTDVNDDRFYADFRGSWTDTLTITAPSPALVGQPGIMTAALLFEYGATTSVTASPTQVAENWGVTLTWGLSGEGIAGTNFSQYELDDEGPVSWVFDPLLNASISPAPSSVVVPVTYYFTFGVPFDISMELQASASGGGPGSPDNENQEWQASATLNFLNTLAWQGITSVTDLEGNPVQFTLDSGTGTDWTQPVTPVPLPAGSWLLASGLASLAFRPRRRVAGAVLPRPAIDA